MASKGPRVDPRTVPIRRRKRRTPSPEGGARLAWALFLLMGVPFGLMTGLTVLARMGIYVDLFRPLWAPWPPDLLKPFLGLAVFAATLAYLAYRLGRRKGYRTGNVAGAAATRTWYEARQPARDPGDAVFTTGTAETPAPPPPPPADQPAESTLDRQLADL